MVSEAKLYFENPSSGPRCAASFSVPAGRAENLEIPSGEVKLNRQFELKDAGATTILLDFDGDKSVKLTGSGKYMMSPVISVVSVK